MLLLQFPPEILTRIFNYVGSSYFGADLSRLTVSKEWSSFAYTACFQDFHFTAESLRALASSPYARSNGLMLQYKMKSIHLYLKGFEDWDSGRLASAAWRINLNQNLRCLSNIIEGSRKLRILRIEATAEGSGRFIVNNDRHYLSQPTMQALVSSEHLTTLDLDLGGTRLLPPGSLLPQGSHFCPIIAGLLTRRTLRRLRLRMERICGDALKPQDTSHLRLNEILINLSLTRHSPRFTTPSHARHCEDIEGGVLVLRAEMVSQAQDLVTHMEAPKMFRILTHEPLSLELLAFDVLTGRIIRLRKDAEWDSDDEVLEAKTLESSDEESEISSLDESN